MIDVLMFRTKLQVVKTLVQDGNTLDVGCGDKQYTVHLPNPIGIDAYKDCDHIYADPDIWMDARDLKFPDGEFSNVCYLDVAEHILEVDVAMKEAWRVLKDDGILVITDPNDFWLFWARIFTLRWGDAFRGRRTERREDEESPGHIHDFNKKSLIELLSPMFVLEKTMNRLIFTGYRFRKVT